tara:strand:- start:511 stop:1074 length:564 start_codon:yes stop_codon:yes gene_type:complete
LYADPEWYLKSDKNNLSSSGEKSMRECLLFLLCICSIPGTVLATPQEDDFLILEGKQIYTSSLRPLNRVFPNLKIPEFDEISTGNRKGYVASWATFQNQLYLIGLEGHVPGQNKLLGNERITPGHRFPLKVTKWSGNIIQEKNFLSYDADTEQSTSISEIATIRVRQGVVTDTVLKVIRKPISNTNE